MGSMDSAGRQTRGRPSRSPAAAAASRCPKRDPVARTGRHRACAVLPGAAICGRLAHRAPNLRRPRVAATQASKRSRDTAWVLKCICGNPLPLIMADSPR